VGTLTCGWTLPGILTETRTNRRRCVFGGKPETENVGKDRESRVEFPGLMFIHVIVSNTLISLHVLSTKFCRKSSVPIGTPIPTKPLGQKGARDIPVRWSSHKVLYKEVSFVWKLVVYYESMK
jgi:hypothetical protein